MRKSKLLKKSTPLPLPGNAGRKAALCPATLVAMVLALCAGTSAHAGGLSLGGGPVDAVEQSVAATVEQTVQDQVAEATAQAVQDAVEERSLTLGDGPVQQAVEQQVEAAVEDSVTSSVQSSVEDTVGAAVTDQVETTVEATVETTVETAVETSIEASVDNSVEQVVDNTVESAVDDQVQSSVEGSVEATVQSTVEQEVQSEVVATVEQGVEGSVEQGLETSVESTVQVAVADSVEQQMEGEIDQILDGIESDFEIDENRIRKDQWLVMAEPEVFEQLAQEGYLFASVTDLPGMGMRLAEVAAPSSFDISRVRQGVIDVVGKDRAQVDLNHIYTAGTPEELPVEQGIAPRKAVVFPADTDSMSLRIGMIDSQVDVNHPALQKAHIHSRQFTAAGAQLPDFHGTAIASIIAASGSDYVGLAPDADVYAASVFEKDPREGEVASTVSLVRALDWLMTSGVDVVNISLAGPPNRLLETALNRARAKGVMILAAAGNGGPVARPMYPAAYDSVVAVTAVDTDGKVFRMANRGHYLDLAAPGVSLLHARAGGGYSASSGTSFAVPFAATAAARLRKIHPGEDALGVLYRSATDLGPPGRDDIYGYGLLNPG